jgi:hypothetical protein
VPVQTLGLVEKYTRSLRCKCAIKTPVFLHRDPIVNENQCPR